ncbi:Gfo/Idh/MocA family protein [Microbacterium sp. CPCC 204701]|uniref:Gfo/Idh/MocA family protein n=1 Tax=Microbacterium sp. CPCC 204701 TaxID=2493084 RepID=UPI000FD92DBC|nr:Gfo/Idh/MocA family oxidoreductase [Microbacterium sp. CPCC 204701]
MSELVRLAVIGAGSRGTNYARLAVATGRAEVVAVVEPDPERRAAFAEEYALPGDAVFSDWGELAATSPLADAAVIATPDRLHVGPAVAFAEAGYHLLLEKPMAPTREDSLRIVEAAERNNVLLMVCHVMRYSAYSRALKALLDSGRIGEIVSVEHLEPIGWWHFAHSYVRGNWAREAESSSMLMAKSSHDLDWLSHIIGRPVRRVSSFGSLSFFTPANMPTGAADRCVDCALVNSCAYSAPTIYGRFLGDPVGERWPLAVLTPQVTAERVDEALRTGPYGECVFNGRNDVADHQVVNLEYTGGVTASFTVTAFTDLDFRKTRIFGTLGSIDGDGRRLVVHEFTTNTRETMETSTLDGASAADGHGGADASLIDAFLDAVRTGDRALIESGGRDSLHSHELVWAAEQARNTSTVVELQSIGALAVG